MLDILHSRRVAALHCNDVRRRIHGVEPLSSGRG